MDMEKLNLDLFDICDCYALGTTTRILGIIIVLLFLTSCAYHTEIPCPFGLTMSQLDKKCDYIQHGSTKKWVLKKEKK